MIDDKTLGKGKKIMGFKELVDPETGEIVMTGHFEHYDVDIGWEKVWLDNLLYAVGLISDKAMKVLLYFIENRDHLNRVVVTKEMVIRHTEVSRGTVYSVIARLLENDILKELELGFQVNPNILFDSAKAKKKKIRRFDVLMSYYSKDKE